jgi:parvulin-like peptidyl-prolyl isomerase
MESTPVHLQHILIGWDKLVDNPDPRAKKRTKEAADKLAKELLEKVRAKGDMAKLMKEHSEDPGSKDDATVYEINRQLPEPLINLAVRLKIDEAGLVRSPFGWHVVKRVVAPPPPPPPPPDKLDSADILKRAPETEKAKVKHILVGWQQVNAGDPRAKKRSRAELEKLVPQILEEAKKEPFESLMIKYSEDVPEAVKSGDAYPVTPDAGLVEPFKKLSLRLKVGEIGVVRTQFGMHVIKRVE